MSSGTFRFRVFGNPLDKAFRQDDEAADFEHVEASHLATTGIVTPPLIPDYEGCDPDE